jgi:hypothetical protein
LRERRVGHEQVLELGVSNRRGHDLPVIVQESKPVRRARPRKRISGDERESPVRGEHDDLAVRRARDERRSACFGPPRREKEPSCHAPEKDPPRSHGRASCNDRSLA